MRTISAKSSAMLAVVLTAAVMGCAARSDLAPVRTGHQRLDDIVPAVPYPSPVRNGQTPPVQSRPEMPPDKPKIQPRVPSPKPHSTKRQAPGPADNTYTVMPGDTLSEIARQTGRGLDDLATWNDLVPPYQVEVGQVLKLSGHGKADRTKTRRKSNASNLTAKKSIMPRSETGKAHRRDAAASKASSGQKNKAELKFAWPLTGKIQKNFAQTGRKGIDIAGKTGQTVRAAETGKVVYSGQGLIGYGNLLIIKHNDEYLTAYANNSALLAREGDVVEKDQEIAKAGSGTSRKAMLHFEIRKQGKSVNPLNFLPKR